MQSATLPLYRARSVQHPKLDAFDLQLLTAGLRRFYNQLPESAPVDRHTREFVQLVLEAAKTHVSKPYPDPEIKPDAKEFASYFLERTPAYSTTKAGLSALLFETWLATHGGELFGLFLETVLTSNTEYLAIFTGELTDGDLRRIAEKTSEFAKCAVAVRYGDKDYKRGIISDVTMLACTAEQSVKDPAKEPQAVKPDEPMPRVESLLPATREAYEALVCEGGLPSNLIPTVFGVDPFGKTRFYEGSVVVDDPNGVVWKSQGSRWLPIAETFRPALTLRMTTPIVQPRAPRAAPVVETVEQLTETDDSGAVRSCYGAWAVFEAPVEGGASTTVVVVRDRAWSVSESLGDVASALARVEQTYAELPYEFDVMAEAFLCEFACDRGVEVSNPTELIVVLESSTSSVEERDLAVAAACRARLIEAGFPPKKPVAAVVPVAPAAPPKPGEPPAPPDEEDPNADPAAAVVPLEPPEPEATSDHMDDPPFYREDLQGFYDLQITVGQSPADALARVRQRYRVKGMIVTPAGEVRAPGVIDRPKDGGSPPPPPPAVAAPAPPPAAPPEIATGGPVSGAAPAQGAPAAPGGPKGKPPGKPAQEGLRESAPVDQQLQLATVDDAFMYWLVYEDGDLDGFNEWLDRFCPHLVTALEVWQPSDAPLTEGRLQALAEAHARRTSTRVVTRHKRELTREDVERYDRWRVLVNLPAPKLRRFLMSESFRESLAGPRAKTTDMRLALESSRVLLAMKTTPVEEWTGSMWNWCGRQTNFIARLRGTSAPLIEQGRVTRKYLTLKAWGHDPAIQGTISESEVIVRQRSTPTSVWECPHCRKEIGEKDLFYGLRDESGGFKNTEQSMTGGHHYHRSCGGELLLPQTRAEAVSATNRLIDSLSGSGPRLIVGEDADAPDFAALKAARTKLDDAERDAVMRAEAVWHHGPKGEKTPAVWKSRLGEQTWFVTNTHRCYQARRSLDGAIAAYHRTVKATA